MRVMFSANAAIWLYVKQWYGNGLYRGMVYKQKVDSVYEAGIGEASSVALYHGRGTACDWSFMFTAIIDIIYGLKICRIFFERHRCFLCDGCMAVCIFPYRNKKKDHLNHSGNATKKWIGAIVIMVLLLGLLGSIGAKIGL